jgi:phospholipase/carboxylesterase
LPDCVEIETGPGPVASVIWLHGLGADGHDFEPIVPELRMPDDLPVRFVFPHAPVRPVTINGGMPMRAWYDIRVMHASRNQDKAGIAESVATAEALIEREIQRGSPASAIVLAGFSQGGAVALHAGLRYPQRLAGLVALSTYLLFPDRMAEERHEANRDLPLFLAHGSMDPVVPFAMGRATLSAMQDAGQPVSWHSYPMMHGVCPDEIADIGSFLRERLKP